MLHTPSRLGASRSPGPPPSARDDDNEEFPDDDEGEFDDSNDEHGGAPDDGDDDDDWTKDTAARSAPNDSLKSAQKALPPRGARQSDSRRPPPLPTEPRQTKKW